MLLAPWFLAGLIAIGVPLWLHRIARTERVKVPFASLMLLEASEVRDTSRRSLRYWVLLAVRIALLLLIVLAFAQPLIQSNSAVLSEQSELHAIVLDRSLSMQYGDRWQRAIEQAQSLVNKLKSSDRVLLVAAAGRKIELVAGPVTASDAGVVRAALSTITPSLDRLDYGMLMTSSSAWLSSEGLPAHIHLITDLQRSASPLRFADLAPPANAQIELLDVSANETNDNFAVVNATVQGAEDRLFTATVHGNAASKVSRELTMSIDERVVATKRVLLDSAGNAQILFDAVKLRTGAHRVQFDLQPHDALPQDDSYFAVIEHSEPMVLLITKEPTADDATYIAAAIESQTSMRLSVENTTPQSLAKTLSAHPLSNYSAVFVADSGILSTADARQLTKYIDAGGSVFLTLGPKAAQLGSEPVTALHLRDANDGEQRATYTDESHPVLRDSPGWQAVRFMKHVNVRLATEDRALITLADGSPLLIERANNAGRLLILTAPLDRAWNDLAIHPLFVRFIADAAQYLTNRDASATSYVVGSRIATGVVEGTGGQIFDPHQNRILALQDAGDASYLTPTEFGFYEVRSGKQSRWLAVNADARESDLTAMNPDNVARWQALTPAHGLPITPGNATQAQNLLKEQPKGHSIGWQLLIAAAALLLIELLLANYRLTIRRDGARTVGAPVVLGGES